MQQVIEYRGTTGDRRLRTRRRGLSRRQGDAPWTSAPRVLLIASNADVRLLLTGLLEEAGYAVYPVRDAIDALQTIGRRLPDAVVLGGGSSGADSLALLTALRTDAETRDIAAVILTGVQVHSAANGRHTGPTMLLREPVSADAVLAAVDDLTRSAPLDRVACRQLRRALLILNETQGRLASGDGREQMVAVINRLHPAVLGIDVKGAVVAASRGAEALIGYDRQELVTMSVFDAAFGSDLPLARSWQAYLEGRRTTGTVSVRDRAGRLLRMHIAAGHVIPGLDAIALAAEIRT